jgi:copper chaperone
LSASAQRDGMARRTLSVDGMACGGCEQNVENALGTLDGVTRVDADHEADAVEFVADGVSDDDVAAAIEDAGYEVRG